MSVRKCGPNGLNNRLLQVALAFAVCTSLSDPSLRAEDQEIPKLPGIDWAENLRRANQATVVVIGTRQFGHRRQTAGGAGVVVSATGYLLTARHLVEGYDRIEVQTVDGDQYLAHVVLTDPEYDLALLKVHSPEPLEAATLASSKNIVAGRLAFVIGNPLGEGQCVRGGKLGDARVVRWDGHRALMRTVQAVILDGNSGGGTFDLETGELLGINVARSPDNDTGYMVCVDRLREILNDRFAIEELIDSELILSELGVRLRRVNLVEGQFQRGMLITAVQEGSVASQAGWERGDILVGLDRYQMVSRNAVLYVLQDATRRSSTVRFLLARGENMDGGVIQLPSSPAIAARAGLVGGPPPNLGVFRR